MNKRLDGDIFSKNPTVLMVTFGMNDSGYYEYNGDNAKEFGEQKYQESIKNFQQMEKRFKELPHTRIVMTGTSPYDETAQIKDNTVFKKKMRLLREYRISKRICCKKWLGIYRLECAYGSYKSGTSTKRS